MPRIQPRTLFYSLLAFGHTLFTMVFPLVSVPLAVWLNKRKLFDSFIALFAVPFFSIVAYYSYKRWKLIKPNRRWVLVTAAALYAAAYIPLEYHPERLHILNFSFMGVIMYKTFSPLMKLRYAVVLSLAFIITVGTIDEFLQRWVVGRSSTFHDVSLCIEGAFLGVTLAWIFDKYSRKGRS